MTKKALEENKWPVPSDWNEETDGYIFVTLCLPNSRQWRSIFYGQISDVAYGRNWNKKTGSIKDAQPIARDIFESITMTCTDEILQRLDCICNALNAMAAQGAVGPQGVDGPASGGEISVGPGEQFPSLTDYEVAKCNISNGIFDTILGFASWLEQNHGDLILGFFGGVTSGIIMGLTLSGPIGWAAIVVGAIVGSTAGYLLSEAVNFEDLQDALSETHEDAVAALFNSTDTDGARAAFKTAIQGGATPITVVELGLVEILLSNLMLNQLFLPRSDMADYESPDPIICTDFCSEIYLISGTELIEGTYQSVLAPGGNWGIGLGIWFNGTAGCGLDQQQNITIESLVGWTEDTHDPGSDQSFRYSSNVLAAGAGCAGWDIHCSDVEPVGALSCRAVNIRSDTNFTMTISVS